MTLFDSLSAEFKLSIETSFSRKTDDGGVRNLVYITDATSTSAGGYGVMNPSIFLVFAHKGEKPTDDKKIYTSYPHLYRIRNILKTLCDWMASPDAYVETDMGLAVHPNFAQPMSIANIGRGSKWISFSLSVIETGTDTVVTRHPGIKIEVSEAAGQYSILTEDELYTLYGIISTLDLANIAVSMSLAYLDANSNNGYAKPAASAPTTAPTTYGRNAVPSTAPGYTGGYVPRGTTTRTAAPSGTTPAYSGAAPVYSKPAYRPTPVTKESRVTTPIPDHVSEDDLPWASSPSSSSNPLSMSSVGEPAVSDIDFEDEDSIARLFDTQD
jgi:hypothetical protein